MSTHLEKLPSITGKIGDQVTVLNEFVLNTSEIENGTQLTITSLRTGEVQTINIMNGHTPVKGEDYWTAADQTEIRRIAEEAASAVIETDTPHQMFVTDKNGSATWQARTHYESVETAENVLLLAGDDPTEKMIAAPVVPYPSPNTSITIRYNGTDYVTTAVEIPEEAVGIAGVIAAGNLSVMDIDGGDASLPFILALVPPAFSTQMGGAYGLFGALDSPESVSVSLVTTGKVVHQLDDKFIGLGNFVITIAPDSTISVEGSFADAWALDERKLASSIKVVTPWNTTWYADGYSVKSVTKIDQNDSPYYSVATIVVDVDEYLDLVDPGTPISPVTWRIKWMFMNGESTISMRPLYGLPDFEQPCVTDTYKNTTHYLRHNAGTTRWSAVSLDEFAKDCPVQSINGKTGAVQLSASDVGAQPTGDYALRSEVPSAESLKGVLTSETWTFTMADGSTVEKQVFING